MKAEEYLKNRESNQHFFTLASILLLFTSFKCNSLISNSDYPICIYRPHVTCRMWSDPHLDAQNQSNLKSFIITLIRNREADKQEISFRVLKKVFQRASDNPNGRKSLFLCILMSVTHI